MNKKTTPSSNASVEHALAALIRNTRTTSRPLSLPEIAAWLEIAAAALGSIREVADRIGLSPQMVKQFLAVKDLSPQVQKLFALRELDSVDMAVHLRKFNAKDQDRVATASVREELNSADIRAIWELRSKYPNMPIEDAVQKVKSSRNIRQYVIEFVVRGPRISRSNLLNRFRKALGDDSVVSLKLSGSIGQLIIDEQGRSRLRALARQHKVTQAESVNKIVMGEIAK
jgi:transcriptional regulator with XRE-family HTH domain